MELITERAYTSRETCAITSHDVLHTPEAPCTSISIPKLRAAGVNVGLGPGGYNIVQANSGLQLSCGTGEGEMFCLCLYADPRGDDLSEGLNLEYAGMADCFAHPEEVAVHGQAAWIYQGIDHWTGTICGEQTAVSC